MGGVIKLFEKDASGLLHEVPAAEADARRSIGTISCVSLQIDVLWTDKEIQDREAKIAARAAEEQVRQETQQAAQLAAIKAEQIEQAAKAAARTVKVKELSTKLRISQADVELILNKE